MIKSMVLAWYGSYGGGTIGDMFVYWEQYGFFAYVLPFLLIFALIFGILERIRIFSESRTVSGIIAFVVGLMALQFDIVPRFFSEVFPRLGVGLAILLIIIILVGLWVDPQSGAIGYTLLGVGAVIAIIVLVSTAGELGWSSGWWWNENWPMVVGVVLILIAIGIIVGSSGDEYGRYGRGSVKKEYRPLAWFEPTGGR
jgi:hypothetical protein